MKKNVFLVILIITTLVASGLAVYFKITSLDNEKKLQEKIDELSLKKDELPKEDNKEIEIQEKVVYTVPEINEEKCINKKASSLYELQIKDSFFYGEGMIYVDSSKKSIHLNLDIDNINHDFGLNLDEEKRNITINNFSGNISDVITGCLGQDDVGDVSLFLMEDGTVEYMPVYNALKDNNIKSYGKIEGISDIVRIENASVRYSDGPGGNLTSLAIKSDGSFYDLEEYLYDKVKKVN